MTLVRRIVRLFARSLAGIFAVALLISFLANTASIDIRPAGAAGATLSFSPSSGTYSVGSNIVVKVTVDSGGGVGINASDGTVSFDPSLLSVQGVSKDSSIFSLWTSDPSYSNNAGTVTWSGGSPSPYTQSGGAIITITFKALKAGTANISFSSASVLAADGNGTNVFGNGGQGTYTLGGSAPPDNPNPTPAPTPTPTTDNNAGGQQIDLQITSPTHPDPEKWYSNRNPELKWTLPPDAEGISTLIDQKPDTAPPKASEGLLDSNTYNDVPDGVNYFHIRVKTQSTGWSEVSNRKIMIDTVPPSTFSADLDQPDHGLSPKAMLQATDTTSGIDHFEVKINDHDTITIPLDQVVNGAYTLPPLLPGDYKALFRAVDKAGNAAELTRQFSIEGQAMPEITQYPQALIEDRPLLVEGNADKMAKVEIRVEQNNKTVSEEYDLANTDGTFHLISKKQLYTGSYQLSARQTTRGGAVSDWTAKIDFSVVGIPFIDKYGLALIVFLICVIIGLGLYLYMEKKHLEKKMAILKRKTDQIKEQAGIVFQALDEEVEEKIHLLDPETAAKLGVEKLTILDVIERLKEALGISQDVINKEIGDVEEELEDR